MANETVMKVFHAARQDLEIFVNLTGRAPAPLFDTQIAAMACGYGESIAYDALVQAILKKRIDKSSRFTDWSRRPLSEAQLVYAMADATHLRDLYPKLHDKLATQHRLEWVSEEIAALSDPKLYDTEPRKCLAAAQGAQDGPGLPDRVASGGGVARAHGANAQRAARSRPEGRRAL